MLRTLRQILSIAVPVLLLLLNLGVLLCHWNRWDEWVAVTLVPIWAWSGLGMVVSALIWALCRNAFPLITFSLWLVTGIALSDETAGLLRDFRAALTGDKPSRYLSGDEEPGLDRLRVATMNCGWAPLGSTEALERLKPDLLLLQQAPDARQLSDLADRIYGTEGGVVRTRHCAIIGRGRLSIEHDDPDTGSLVATFERAGGGESIDVINFLLPTAFALTDLWTPRSWPELAERRRSNRRLLRGLIEALPERIGEEYRIAGGSFGAPPSDDIFRLLRKEGLVDGFRQAGYGWGNTFPESAPVLRLDQIWASEQFQPVRSETYASEVSDHRFVVTDYFRLKPIETPLLPTDPAAAVPAAGAPVVPAAGVAPPL